MTAVLRWLIPLLLSLAAVGYWGWLYLRYGQEHRPEPCPDLLPDPPYDWTPAQVSYLCNWGELRPQEMIATMVDLACRGVISLEAEPVTVLEAGGLLGVDQEYSYYVSRNPRYGGELSQSERHLVEQVLMLRAGADERVSLSDLMVEGARNLGDAWGRFDAWRQLSAKEPQPVPLEDGISLKRSRVGASIGLALALLCYPTVALLKSPYSLALVAIGAALMLGSRVIRRRSQEAANAFRRWQAYRAHLASVPDLAELPVQSIILAGRPLVYAIGFGIARAATEPFRLLCPDWQTLEASQKAYPSAFSTKG